MTGYKKKLFIIADAGVDTGFANVTHNLVEHLWTLWDIHILAINYMGDPHPLQQKVKLYNPSAQIQGDYYGSARVKPLLNMIQPDVLFMINDPWVAAQYVPLIQEFTGNRVLYTPIDGQNIKDTFVKPLEIFDHIVTYTQFGKQQLEQHLQSNYHVIPHGVNKKIYQPVDKKEARQKNNFSDDWFIINVTDRNQIRKRIDLALYYFSEWIRNKPERDNIKLHYHGALNDEGWDIIQLAQYMGIANNLIITSPNITPAHGLPLELMPWVYGVADVGLTTTMGEGWGLTIAERMAMKVPMIVPKYSALAEWTDNAVAYAEISDIPFFNIKGLNTRGGIADKTSVIQNLEKLYTDQAYRQQIAEAGYRRMTQPTFNWKYIAASFNSVFSLSLKERG